MKPTGEERQMLTQRTTTSKTAVATLRHARILLKAEAAVDDGAWSDERIADALDTSLSTIARVRKQFVENGWQPAFYRKKPTGRHDRKVESISPECVRMALKKTTSSRG